MTPERINDLINQDFSKLPPIKLQLAETLSVEKLKERVENEYMIPKNVQQWFIGKTLDNDDEVTMNPGNLCDNKSIFLVLSSPVMEVCTGAEPRDIDNEMATTAKENLNAGKIENSVNNINDKKKNNNLTKKGNDTDGKVKENVNLDGVNKIEKKLNAKEKRKLWFAEKRKSQKLWRERNREEWKQRRNGTKNKNLPKPHVEEKKQEQEFVKKKDEKINEMVVDSTDEEKEPASKIVKENESMVFDENVESHEKNQDNIGISNEEKPSKLDKDLKTLGKEESVEKEHEELTEINEIVVDLDEEKEPASEIVEDEYEIVEDELMVSNEKPSKLDENSKILRKPHKKPLETNENNFLNDNAMINSAKNQLVPQVKNLNPSLADIPLETTSPAFMSFNKPCVNNIPTLKLRSKNDQPKTPIKFNWSDEDGAVGFDNSWQCQQPDESLMDEEDQRFVVQQRRGRRNQMDQELEEFSDNILVQHLFYINQEIHENEEKDLQLALQMSQKRLEENNKNINNNWPIVKSEVFVNKNLNSGAEEKKESNEFMRLLEMDLIPNTYEFKCPICLEFIGSNQGIILHGCSHEFCRACLRKTIIHCEEPVVKCPFTDEYTCESTLWDREIKGLVDVDTYERHVEKSLICVENEAGNEAFHCLTPDCRGWCYSGGFGLAFYCDVCCKTNCLVCRVIHKNGETCDEYQENLEIALDRDKNLKLTENQIQEMVANREVMLCTCGATIVKDGGCDSVVCKCCKTLLCWPTRGPRWGPKGQGDNSGGCQCGVPPGKLCHVECTGCH